MAGDFQASYLGLFGVRPHKIWTTRLWIQGTLVLCLNDFGIRGFWVVATWLLLVFFLFIFWRKQRIDDSDDNQQQQQQKTY